jgi:hypothetical protein
MKAYGRVFLTSALVGGEWSASRFGRFTPGERTPGIHWIGGWVGRRTCLDNMEERKFLPLPGLELRPVGPTRIQLLYRLRYPGSPKYVWDDVEMVFHFEINYLEKTDLVKKEETFTLTA